MITLPPAMKMAHIKLHVPMCQMFIALPQRYRFYLKKDWIRQLRNFFKHLGDDSAENTEMWYQLSLHTTTPTRGPWAMARSPEYFATADMQMLCNIFQILSLQLITRPVARQDSSPEIALINQIKNYGYDLKMKFLKVKHI